MAIEAHLSCLLKNGGPAGTARAASAESAPFGDAPSMTACELSRGRNSSASACAETLAAARAAKSTNAAAMHARDLFILILIP